MTMPNPSLVVGSVKEVYQAASSIFIHVRHRLEDIKARWILYNKQGLLPETEVFNNLKYEIDEHLKMLRIQEESLCSRIMLFDPAPTIPGGSDVNWGQAPDRWSKFDQVTLSEIKSQLFDSVQFYSEALTYLTQHLNNRVGTLSVSEAIHGSYLTMHRFSGMQVVYDAAESLMSDYASSLGNNKYQGLVVFGYDYQAAAWKSKLNTFPLFAERPAHMPMLAMLAHEAAHWLQADKPLEEFRRKIVHRLTKLVEKYKGFAFLPLLGPVSVDSHTRFHPTKSQYRRLSGEIVSDFFATLVAGPAYLRVLARYFLPLHVDSILSCADLKKKPDPEEVSWTFYASSFKLRIAIEIAEMIGFIDDEEARAIGNYGRMIEWALTDIAARYSPELPASRILRAALEESYGTNRPIPQNAFEVLNAIRGNIEDMARHLVKGHPTTEDCELSKTILNLFKECTNDTNFRPYAPIDTPSGLRTDNDEYLSKFFQKEVSLQAVLDFWKDHREYHPRHLISVLVPPFHSHSGDKEKSGPNHFAVIFALAHHPSIIGRYQRIRTSER